MRLLLVEDSDDLRQLFARFLKGHGFEVCEAGDAQEAIGHLQEFVPEIIITDLMMPGIDGLELIRRIKTIPALERATIVVITAAATNETEQKVRWAGASALLAKPIDARTLLGCLEDNFR